MALDDDIGSTPVKPISDEKENRRDT